MNRQSFTTSSAVVKTDNDGTIRSDISDVQDFFLLCNDANVTEAVHALYYLPQNYKLMIARAKRSDSSDAWIGGTSLQNRIRFEDSPVTADAIISDESDDQTVEPSHAPHIVVSAATAASLATNGYNGFTVQSGNPEALASAILRISRHQLA